MATSCACASGRGCVEHRRCPPCKYDPCYCDGALKLQEEFEKRGSYPFVRQMECRRCHAMRRFVFDFAAQDAQGTRWGHYRDALGHEDYISLTVQDFATLTSTKGRSGHSKAPHEARLEAVG